MNFSLLFTHISSLIKKNNNNNNKMDELNIIKDILILY